VIGAFNSSLRCIWNEISNSPLAATPAIPDGSYKITDRWKLSAGVRWYQYKSEQDEFEWGYDGPSPTPPASSCLCILSYA
jgi:hypothetical protein